MSDHEHGPGHDHHHNPSDSGGATIGANPIVGIDLGTTNSLIAIVENGVPRILPTVEGEHLLPSALSFDGDATLYGNEARRARLERAGSTITSVKRFLGKKYSDFSADERALLPFALHEGPEDSIVLDLGGRRVNAIEASAMVLGSLKRSAETALGRAVREAVITVPAYFNDTQRQATRLAGRLAGLDVLRIVNEPTAAALAYGLQSKRNGVIAVYDLGGGTFDLSILRLEEGIFEVLATSGNTALGGDDFDRAILESVRADLEAALGAKLAEDLPLRVAVLEECERVKKALSTSEAATFSVSVPNGSPSSGSASPGDRTFSREIAATEFAALARPLLERTRKNCDSALRDSGLTWAEITDVILVGGPTRLAAVRDFVAELFGRVPNQSVHPDEVVALGAAIQADILAGHNKEFLLLDVVPLSLGIETYGNLFSVLIPRNTKVPAQARESFTTYVDRQTGVDIHVLQGEREKADENRSLARFKLAGLDPSPAGFPRIEVRFLIDADGILQVSARDLRTGREQLVEVRPAYGLGDADVARMIEAAGSHAEEDFAHRRWLEVLHQADPVLRATETKLADARRLLDPAEADSLTALCARMRGAIESRDVEATQNLKYELNAATVRLAELVIRERLNQETSDA